MKLLRIKTALLIVGLCFGSISVGNGYTSDKYFEFINSIYDQHEKKLSDFLLDELVTFMKTFPESENIAEASYLMALVYLERGQEHESFAAHMKTLFLYPNSSIHSVVVESASKIIANNKKYKNSRAELTELIEGTFENDDLVDRNFRYISFLYELGHPKLYDWSLTEFELFISIYITDARSEEIQLWISDIYTNKGDDKVAVASYLKYEYLHPTSQHLPFVKTQRGIILYEELKNYESALNVFSEVIEKYPSSEYAGSSLFYRAEIKAHKIKDFEGAIADYRSLVTIYPQHDHSIDALFEIASINAVKLKSYHAAVTVLDEIVKNYPDNILGVEALLRSAKILQEKLKNVQAAAAKYAMIATAYPDYEKSPEMLMKAAEICEKKLKNYEQAINYYELVSTQYPSSKSSKKALEKIKKIKEKLAE